MKTILYMAQTVNGFIAKPDDDTSWISQEEWDSYSLAVRNTGCFIIGRRTYEILTKQPEFSEIKNVKLVVVSQEDFETLAPNHVVVHSPKEALGLLEKEGFETALVAGGGTLNGSFMKEKLIDEIYLDIEPVAFGKGIKLFGEEAFEAKLELMETKKLSENEIQLHYKVLK